MGNRFDAKAEAKALCGLCRDHAGQMIYDKSQCFLCCVAALTEAEAAGYRRGVEAALALVWCPPTCEDPMCEAVKIRALLTVPKPIRVQRATDAVGTITGEGPDIPPKEPKR